MAVLAMTLCCLAVVTHAQRAKTAEAQEFGVWVDDVEHIIVGIAETVPGTDEGVGLEHDLT